MEGSAWVARGKGGPEVSAETSVFADLDSAHQNNTL